MRQYQILVQGPHGLNKLLEEDFEFPFNLICKLTMAFLTCQSWPILESWHTGLGEQEFWYCFDDELNQAQVVQTLDSAIHRINHYPADKYYRTNCAIQWIVICRVDSVFHLMDNWGQKFSSVCGIAYSSQNVSVRYCISLNKCPGAYFM